MKKEKSCCQCGKHGSDLSDSYGHIICESCKSRLGLFTDETIAKHVRLFAAGKNRSYEDEVRDRLAALEKDFIRKKIKLLHIQERLKYI